MKHTSGLSITLAAIWVLSACAILEPRAKEDLSEGYALLYNLVPKEKQSSQLSIIKTISPELKSLLERISENVQGHGERTGHIGQNKSAADFRGLASAENRTSCARIHRQGDDQTDVTQHRRGPGVQHGEFATGSNELHRASSAQFGRC